jgi:homoserine kinase
MVTVIVPATTANLGPGFDCLGAALSLYTRFSFELQPEGLTITGCGQKEANKNNLVYRAYLHTLQSSGRKPSGLLLHIDSDIPPARGLGSSAACVAGGILGACALHSLDMDQEEVFALAAALEGHPDNAAPAVYGGLRVSIQEGGKPYSLPAVLHPDLRFLALVPDFELKTIEARAALPANVTREDAVYNLSHTAFLLKALENGDPEMIRLACHDRLHQPARFGLIPGSLALQERMEQAGAAACYLSGAGPALMCLYTKSSFPDTVLPLIKADFPRFTALPLKLCEKGAAIERNT